MVVVLKLLLKCWELISAILKGDRGMHLLNNMNGALWINYREQGTFMHYLKTFMTWLLIGGHWKIQYPETAKML